MHAAGTGSKPEFTRAAIAIYCTLRVAAGFDVADNEIVRQCRRAICDHRRYTLAAEAIEKGAAAQSARRALHAATIREPDDARFYGYLTCQWDQPADEWPFTGRRLCRLS